MQHVTANTINPCQNGQKGHKDSVRFSFVSKEPDCGILLYDKKTDELIRKIPFCEEDRTGFVYTKTVEEIDVSETTYLFYQKDTSVPDRHATSFVKNGPFGTKRKESAYKANCVPTAFAWNRDKRPCIPYADCIFYGMHVRGFTAHPSSGVKAPGTYRGIMEKIPYLKEIGVTSVLLQPAYEFIELPEPEEEQENTVRLQLQKELSPERLNYWGYTKGFYYAPKANYAYGEDAGRELKELVQALHLNHMELLMQFYFPEDVCRGEICEILRFWLTEYHIDGFYVMGPDLPIDLICEDPLLADCKILSCDISNTGGGTPVFAHLAQCNDQYLYDMRRFLKGDENMLDTALYHMRHIPSGTGRVHYFTNYCGFTLADLVSYNDKHNEANGEQNQDGAVYNCSWNCGEEGPSKSRKVNRLRLQQIQNAIAMLLLTASAPMIFMGDEFGNSQQGNNNPYCQDNETTWLDWSLVRKGNRVLSFWKKMTAFRREHPILTPSKELLLMDTLSCGYPDLSYHGESAWKLAADPVLRHAGIMLCGKYAKKGSGEDDFLYIAMNMHWESHPLALPKLPKTCQWVPVLSTAASLDETDCEIRENCIVCAPRSITVYVATPTVPLRVNEIEAGQKTKQTTGKRKVL